MKRAPAELFDLTGRIACVTGASSGLGQAAADALIAAGAQVVGVARRHAELSAWRESAGPRAATVCADLADLDSLPSAAQHIAAPFGAPDILVNAAGINTRQPADDVEPEKWRLSLDLNLSAPFYLSQALVPGMKKNRWGRIVNFASLQSFRAFHGGIAYGAAKGGLAQLTRAMAEAWSSEGVNANAVAPGFFRTPLTAPVFEDGDLAGKLAAQTCIGRNGEPADLVGPLIFLCSDASAYVTGQVLPVDGGFTAK
ncbi:MAG: SDR family oxidoreductase [Pseudomonadota bacterium]